MQVIAEHLYREGRFQLADKFVAEAAIPDAQSIKGPYTALHSILEQVRNGALLDLLCVILFLPFKISTLQSSLLLWSLALTAHSTQCDMHLIVKGS
jgi:hypothetical protein